MTQINQDTQAKLPSSKRCLKKIPAKNMYRIDRAAFTDEELFELEMKHIFEGNWIFLAHESQIPNVNDYLNISRRPPAGAHHPRQDRQLHAMANTCTHRGARLPAQEGQQVQLHLPVPRLDLQQHRQAAEGQDQTPTPATPECFNKDGSHDLVKLGAFENYRGFLFGSINPDVVPSPSTWAKRPRSST